MTDGRRLGDLGALASKGRFGRFASVGVVGASCDATVLVVLSEGLGVLPEVATLAGIETAILVMFLINERWTFAEAGAAGRRSLLHRLKRSHLVRGAGSLTQFLVFVLVYRLLFVPLVLGDVAHLRTIAAGVGLGANLADFDLWLLVAKGTGIGVAFTVNYVAESLYTWRVGLEE